MIRQFKNGYYTEDRKADVRKGDLVVLSGVMGILRSEYNPDYMELETEGGSFYTHFGCAGVVKLRKIEQANSAIGLHLKKARR